jgi:hypothetical protein
MKANVYFHGIITNPSIFIIMLIIDNIIINTSIELADKELKQHNNL